MSMCRRFHGEPVTRLIVSVPVNVVADVDSLIAGRWYSKHPANGTGGMLKDIKDS